MHLFASPSYTIVYYIPSNHSSSPYEIILTIVRHIRAVSNCHSFNPLLLAAKALPHSISLYIHRPYRPGQPVAELDSEVQKFAASRNSDESGNPLAATVVVLVVVETCTQTPATSRCSVDSQASSGATNASNDSRVVEAHFRQSTLGRGLLEPAQQNPTLFDWSPRTPRSATPRRV